MSVETQHKSYTENINTWHMLRDCDDGARAVKSRSAGGEAQTLQGERGTKYLPPPNPTDLSIENRLRYRAYRNRANYVNFVGSTREGLCGLVWRKDPVIELGSSLEYMASNANGDGLPLEGMLSSALNEALLMGRYGLLVDYPTTPDGMTRAQVASQGLQANILPYRAETIINWQCTTMGGVRMLSLLVLMEDINIQGEDEYSYDTVTVYRVLRLNDAGAYTQALYDKDGIELMPPTEVRKSDGSLWRSIPFVFVGSVNNDEQVDKSPLYDIAEVNLAHYRNSADLEESSFVCGQPTPVIAGLTQGWVDANFKGGLHFGSNAFVPLPEGGSAALLQASPNTLPGEIMDKKEQQMIKLGARIIEDTGGQETAEAARIRFAGQNSKLGAVIGNVESAFMQCLGWAADFMGDTDYNIEINRQLYDATIDPQIVLAKIQLMDRGVIAKADVRQSLRSAGMISDDRTDEMLDSEAESQNPLE